MEPPRNPTSQDGLRLVPYLPRLVLEWLRDCPQRRARQLEGTLVFVDISGFTAMSERLARQGRAGSEEVTELLNATFMRLLAVAYENGGSLLKFGGDALLLFFTGREHESRACHAAWGMRAKLREIGRLKSSSGLVTLRMSVGVHSGRFQFFLVGEDHRELMVTGPAASRTVLMEQGATAGEILISDETAAALAPECRGEARAGGVLLRRAPVPPLVVDGEDSDVDVRDLDVASCVPEQIRGHLVGRAGDGEHRFVTLAFLHYGGLDALLADGRLDEAAQRLHELVTTVQAAVRDFGVCFLGTDVDHDGGKIILTAGAPVSSDEDDERMLRATRAIIEADLALPVRIGVHRGHVFAGDVGPMFRRTYTVMGDSVNLAARVMSRAMPGEVLATLTVLDSTTVDCVTTELEPFLVKGKTKPVRAARVDAVRGMRAETAETALPVFGRDDELDALLEDASAVGNGQGRFVEIVGEAGIGETRLVEELLARSSFDAAFVVQCEHYESQTPYFVFKKSLRRLCGIADDAYPADAGAQLVAQVERVAPQLRPWVPLLALVVDAEVERTKESDDIAPEFRTAWMHQAAAEFVVAMLGGTTAIVFEDAHWMDEASGALLRHLVENILTVRPWLVCVTRRDGEGGWRPDAELGARTLVLVRLDAAAAVALAAAASEELLLPQPQVEILAQRSGGHPLFLRKLVTAVAETGVVDALPESVEAAVAARLDRLAAHERTVLRHAAVLGETFTVDALAGISDVPDIESPRTWHRLGEFVVALGAGRMRFRQALVRDVAYEGLPFRRRRDLHAKATRYLERTFAGRYGEVSGLLSLHCARASDHRGAWHWAQQAGDSAKGKGANVDAATFYRRALDATRHLPDVSPHATSAVWEALGDVQQLAGMYEPAAEAFRSARRDGPADVQARLLLKEGIVRERLGRYSQALRWFGRGLRSAATNPATTSDRVQLLIAIAVARQRQGRYRECIELCGEVLGEAEAIGDKASLAYAYFLLHSAYTDLGSGETERYRALALPIYEELGDLVGQSNVLESLGADAYWEGRWDEALSYYERSKELRDRAGHVVYARIAANNIGEVLSDQGHLEQAEDHFRESRRIQRAARFPIGVAFGTSNLGRAAARAGRFDEAAELLDEALAEFTEIGAESFVLETQARIAELRVLRGDPAAALTVVDEADDLALRLGGMTAVRAILHRVWGYALAQQGDPDLARAALEASLRLARESRAAYEEALTLEALARLAASLGDDGSTAAAAAQVLFDRLGVVRTPAVPLPERLPEPARASR